jgi:ketosteroid isomerase-like protein
MEPRDVVAAWWDRVEARDWPAAGALLAPDVVVEWPVTAERFVGRDDFVAVQREYPEGWSIRVREILADGDRVVSHVDVPHVEMGLSHAVSLWTVRDGAVVAAVEYWTSPGMEPAPDWRRPYAS